MNASETLSLPCTPVIDGKPTMLDFTGHRVGHFFIHRDFPDRQLICGELWTITHVATGFAVQKKIRSRGAAMRAAQKLNEIDCWDFTSPEQARALPDDVMERINEIRRSA